VKVLQEAVGQPGAIPAPASPEEGHEPVVGELLGVLGGRRGAEDLERRLVRQDRKCPEGAGKELEEH